MVAKPEGELCPAKEAYMRAAELDYARAWDPQWWPIRGWSPFGWFWSPSDVANDRLLQRISCK
jgi:hypothetical protein